jgi:hypothetical protein
MNEQQVPPLTDEALKRAAHVLKYHKLTALEENWRSGRHRLTIIATPDGGILVEGEVRPAASHNRCPFGSPTPARPLGIQVRTWSAREQ